MFKGLGAFFSIDPIILLGGGAVDVFEVGGGETTIEGVIVVGGFETVKFSFTITELDFLYFGRIISLTYLQMFKDESESK